MHRIDSINAEADKFGSGKDGFTEGSPGVTPATEVTEDWLDMCQEELISVIEMFSIDPVKADNAQLVTAFKVMQDLRNLNTWTEKNASAGVDQYNGAAFSDRFNAIAVGDSATIESTTDGGFTWSAEAAGGGYAGDFKNVKWLNDALYVAVGSAGGIETSPDGSTWTKRSPDAAFGGTFYGAAYGASLYCIVGSSGEIQTSPDGATWTARSADAAYAGTFYDVHFADDLFVAVGYDGAVTGVIQTSPDGITWTQRVSAVGALLTVTYDTVHGRWFAPTSGAIRVSDDGLSWSTQTLPTGTGGDGNVFMFGTEQNIVVCLNGTVGLYNWCAFTFDGGTTWYRCFLDIHNTGAASYPGRPAVYGAEVILPKDGGVFKVSGKHPLVFTS